MPTKDPKVRRKVLKPRKETSTPEVSMGWAPGLTASAIVARRPFIPEERSLEQGEKATTMPSTGLTKTETDRLILQRTRRAIVQAGKASLESHEAGAKSLKELAKSNEEIAKAIEENAKANEEVAKANEENAKSIEARAKAIDSENARTIKALLEILPERFSVGASEETQGANKENVEANKAIDDARIALREANTAFGKANTAFDKAEEVKVTSIDSVMPRVIKALKEIDCIEAATMDRTIDLETQVNVQKERALVRIGRLMERLAIRFKPDYEVARNDNTAHCELVVSRIYDELHKMCSIENLDRFLPSREILHPEIQSL